VSRWTRASIASSLCALSLLAAGCGSGPTHEQAEVQRAEEGIEWISAHVDQIREQVRREYPRVTDDEAFEDFDVARRDNVVVIYARAAERRVRAALDRLD
jgi:hypothetical protein